MKLNELDYIERNIKIPSTYLRRIIETYMFGDRPLESLMISMAGITSHTGREMSAIVYSKIPRKIAEYKSARSIHHPNFRIVPSLGDLKSVQDPEFYNSDLYKDYINKPGGPYLVLPLVHIHTHPEGMSFTSENDLINSKKRYKEEIYLGSGKIRIINPTLNIIIGVSPYPGNPNPSAHSFTFYQLNGNQSALESFIRNYKKHHSKANEKTIDINHFNKDDPLTEVFMRELKDAKVCDYLHFPSVNNNLNHSKSLFSKHKNTGNYYINKKHLTKIASKFNYNLKVTRIY